MPMFYAYVCKVRFIVDILTVVGAGADLGLEPCGRTPRHCPAAVSHNVLRRSLSRRYFTAQISRNSLQIAVRCCMSVGLRRASVKHVRGSDGCLLSHCCSLTPTSASFFILHFSYLSSISLCLCLSFIRVITHSPPCCCEMKTRPK